MQGPGPPAPGRGAGRLRGRAPFGIASVAVALVASLPIWAFDRLEGFLGGLMPEGITVFLAIVGAFALVWFVAGGAILALLSPRPDREGLLAGALVTALMLAILVWEVDIGWQVVLLLWVMFGSLAMGCGALAGLIGTRLQRREAAPAGRAGAIVAIASAIVIALSAGVLMGGVSGGPGLFVLGVVAALGGSGTWWLLRSRRAQAKG